MLYKYRWPGALLINLLFFILGFFYLIQPQSTTLVNLRQIKRPLTEQLASYQAANSLTDFISLPKQKKLSSLAVISNLFTAAELEIQILHAIAAQAHSSGSEAMHVVASGGFNKVVDLLARMQKQSQTILLQDFSYRLKENKQFVFTADLILFKSSRKKNQAEKIRLAGKYNPFCLEQNTLRKNANELLPNVELGQIKMVGYLQQAQRVQALILLPNHTVMAVEKGNNLGKENAIITAILPTQIQLQLPNKTQIILLLKDAT